MERVKNILNAFRWNDQDNFSYFISLVRRVIYILILKRVIKLVKIHTYLQIA